MQYGYLWLKYVRELTTEVFVRVFSAGKVIKSYIFCEVLVFFKRYLHRLGRQCTVSPLMFDYKAANLTFPLNLGGINAPFSFCVQIFVRILHHQAIKTVMIVLFSNPFN